MSGRFANPLNSLRNFILDGGISQNVLDHEVVQSRSFDIPKGDGVLLNAFDFDTRTVTSRALNSGFFENASGDTITHYARRERDRVYEDGSGNEYECTQFSEVIGWSADTQSYVYESGGCDPPDGFSFKEYASDTRYLDPQGWETSLVSDWFDWVDAENGDYPQPGISVGISRNAWRVYRIFMTLKMLVDKSGFFLDVFDPPSNVEMAFQLGPRADFDGSTFGDQINKTIRGDFYGQVNTADPASSLEEINWSAEGRFNGLREIFTEQIEKEVIGVRARKHPDVGGSGIRVEFTRAIDDLKKTDVSGVGNSDVTGGVVFPEITDNSLFGGDTRIEITRFEILLNGSWVEIQDYTRDDVSVEYRRRRMHEPVAFKDNKTDNLFLSETLNYTDSNGGSLGGFSMTMAPDQFDDPRKREKDFADFDDFFLVDWSTSGSMKLYSADLRFITGLRINADTIGSHGKNIPAFSQNLLFLEPASTNSDWYQTKAVKDKTGVDTGWTGIPGRLFYEVRLTSLKHYNSNKLL